MPILHVIGETGASEPTIVLHKYLCPSYPNELEVRAETHSPHQNGSLSCSGVEQGTLLMKTLPKMLVSLGTCLQRSSWLLVARWLLDKQNPKVHWDIHTYPAMTQSANGNLGSQTCKVN